MPGFPLLWASSRPRFCLLQPMNQYWHIIINQVQFIQSPSCHLVSSWDPGLGLFRMPSTPFLELSCLFSFLLATTVSQTFLFLMTLACSLFIPFSPDQLPVLNVLHQTMDCSWVCSTFWLGGSDRTLLLLGSSKHMDNWWLMVKSLPAASGTPGHGSPML